jgi:hypothetical protein
MRNTHVRKRNMGKTPEKYEKREMHTVGPGVW